MSKGLTYKFLGDFIDGRFTIAERPDGEWKNQSPADLKETVFESAYCNDHVNEACSAAKKAFNEWAHIKIEDRINYLMKLKDIYMAYEDKMAESISRETGKPLWEAKTEAKALAGKINVTINYSIKLIAEEKVEDALPGVDGFIRYKPRGVMAIIGPFNFPAHLANGHIIPSLLTGNTVIFKPSDKTPATGQLMAEIFEKAGFPNGVFNLIQGDGSTGRRLVSHEWVDGIFFTGSYEVGLQIKQEILHHHWKILALEMGGKNTTIVWKDADLEKAIYETVIGAFLTSGQRCSCTSKVLLHKDIYDKFLDNFYETTKKLTIGYWQDNKFMGPLISSDSVEKFIRFQEIAKREGAESLMRGKVLNLDRDGYYVTPSINLVDEFNPKSVYQKSEIFGPNVAVYKVDDFDKAIEINNASGYGLVMALFSKDRNLYKKALIDAKVGLLNWNRTTNGASSRLPFGGMGKSGNDRPSGHFAINHCTVPVTTLEDMAGFDRAKLMPGVDYEFKK